MIKKLLTVLALCLLTTGLLVSQASALTTDCLDCKEIKFILDTYQGEVSTEWGTMTLWDDGNSVGMSIDMTGPSDGYKIKLFGLNWTDESYHPDLSMTGTDGYGNSMEYNLSWGPYTTGEWDGEFDLGFNPMYADAYMEPYNGSIYYTWNSDTMDLDPCLFYETNNDGTGPAYVALQVWESDTNNYWVYSTNAEWIPKPAPVVPEPSTMLLLGAGLTGLAGVRWRRRKNG